MKRFACKPLLLTVMAILTLATTMLHTGSASAAALDTSPPSITEYPLPPSNAHDVPGMITTGPDGALWFTDNNNQIGRISTTGSFSFYTIPTPNSQPTDITSGPDGALWFTEYAANQIGRITTSGTFTEYPVPSAQAGVQGITSGPDGALWFTESWNNANHIGRITTSGSISEYPLPTPGAGAQDITSGPDGALWFTEHSANGIGRITTSGVVTEYSLNPYNATATDITSGPDGALWFTDGTRNQIGRITTTGNISFYALPTPTGSSTTWPYGIVSGPDGALWFTQQNPGQVGRITTSGSINEYTPPAGQTSEPWGITSGPDGALWFTESGNSAIARIGVSSPPPPPPSYQLSLTPASQTVSAGAQGLVTATLLDADTGAPISGAKLSFRAAAGPNAGTNGMCLPSACATDANGQVNWGYVAYTYGADTVQAWIDSNGNGVPDSGELQAAANVMWGPPTVQPTKSASWAGYVLTNPPVQPVTALITVPTVPSGCTTSHYAAFWVGFNGSQSNTNYLPQIGFNADCRAADVIRKTTTCGPKRGPAYYLWWELNPHTGAHRICSPQIKSGDRVYVSVQPEPAQVTLTAFVVHPDGSTSSAWSHPFPVSKPAYTSMECIAEDPLQGRPVPLTTFSPVEFDGCSAILDYRAGSTLQRLDIYVPLSAHVYGPQEAQTSSIRQRASSTSFTVTRMGG